LGFGGGSSGLASPPQTKILVIPVATYVATVAEASKVFSIPAAFQDGANISHYLVTFDGSVNPASTMELRFRINGISSALYYSWGYRRLQSTGVETATTIAAVTAGVIADTTTLPAQDVTFVGSLYIATANTTPQFNDRQVNAWSDVMGVNGSGAQRVFQRMSHNHSVTLANDLITSIEILASVNWTIGTRITLYAYKRADT